MAQSKSSRPDPADYKAAIITAWVWVVVVAIMTVIIMLLVPQLPSTVDVIISGARGSGDAVFPASPSGLSLVSTIVVVVFALIVLVARLTIARSQWWVVVALLLLSIFITIAAANVLVSVIIQVGHSAPLYADWRQPVDYHQSLLSIWVTRTAALFIVLASWLFIPRRLTLGQWRSLSHKPHRH